jgi:hypothetical protein
VGTAADQLRLTIWFFAFSGLIALMTVSASELRANGLLALLPGWIAGSMIFWLWTPRFLLHRKISFRSLLPGALLATFVVGGTIATSPLWIGPTLNQNGKAFGSFGVVIGLFAYVLIIVTISMVCAVFAPVWAEWRQGEKNRKTQGVEPTDVRSKPETAVRSDPTVPEGAPSGVDPAASTSSSGRALRRSRRQALVRATAAVRSTDPASVESALKDLGGRRRWLAPLVYAAGTVAVVFDGVLLLLRN